MFAEQAEPDVNVKCISVTDMVVCHKTVNKYTRQIIRMATDHCAMMYSRMAWLKSRSDRSIATQALMAHAWMICVSYVYWLK